MKISDLLLALIALMILAAAIYFFYPAIAAALASQSPPRIERLDTQSPSHQSIAFSIVIPAYNEQDRLPHMLAQAYAYLSRPNCHALSELAALHTTSSGAGVVEWIVVSDGSTDATCAVARDFYNKNVIHKNKHHTFTILSLPTNAGKGAAVRAGMLHARGQYRLFVDADGATDFEPGLDALIANNKRAAHPIVFGSRAHLQSTSAAQKRGIVRQALMRGFQFCCALIVGATEIQDTQCGFKLFRADCADVLFRNLHLTRWAFDTELVYMAKQLDLSIVEVHVPWKEVDGSKLNTSPLNLALVAISMLRDMICVRLCYTLGIWKIEPLRKGVVKKTAPIISTQRRKED
jgi:dolichyl-phosphate beta-glucosyltransferase